MNGNFKDVLESMQNGTTDYTEDGKCSGCGACCSCLLPLSDAEEKFLRRYIKKNHIKPIKKGIGLAKPSIDLTCPFLDAREKYKCRIYDVRPDICRAFQCNHTKEDIIANRDLFWQERHGVNMWDLFEEEEE